MRDYHALLDFYLRWHHAIVWRKPTMEEYNQKTAYERENGFDSNEKFQAFNFLLKKGYIEQNHKADYCLTIEGYLLLEEGGFTVQRQRLIEERELIQQEREFNRQRDITLSRLTRGVLNATWAVGFATFLIFAIELLKWIFDKH